MDTFDQPDTFIIKYFLNYIYIMLMTEFFSFKKKRRNHNLYPRAYLRKNVAHLEPM